MKISPKPLISIILPVYNGEKFLEQAIISCLHQTYKNFELIIVNDCSTDKSLDIINKWSNIDSRIFVVNNKNNRKLPASLNTGHNIAKGKYITWTSDDNILKERFLENLISEIKKEKVDVVFSNYDIIWENGDLKREQETGPVRDLLFGDVIGASFMYRYEVYETLGGYNENFFLVEDYHFFLKASLNFRFHHLNKNLYQYRIHHDSLSAKIHTDKDYRNDFQKVLLKMYLDLEYRFDPVTINLLLKLYLQIPIPLDFYFTNKKIIERDVLAFQNLMNSPEKESLEQLNFLFRENWFKNKKELSIQNLLKVLKKNKSLIFGNYNRNRTIVLIYKCFKNW